VLWRRHIWSRPLRRSSYFKNTPTLAWRTTGRLYSRVLDSLRWAKPGGASEQFCLGSRQSYLRRSAGIGGVVAPVGAPGAAPVTLGHEDFSFDPRTLIIRTEAGSAHTGLCFDNRGRKYVSDLAHPLQAVMFPARYSRAIRFSRSRRNSPTSSILQT